MSIISKPKEGLKESVAFLLGLSFAYLVMQTVDPALVDGALTFTVTLITAFLGARVGTKVGDAFATMKARAAEVQASAVVEAAKLSPKK